MGRLGSNTESASAPEIDRYGLQRVTWSMLPERPRLRACCTRLARSNEGENGDRTVKIQRVTHDSGQETYGFSGLMRCGSGWTCPICAPQIAAERAKEIAHAMRQHRESGGEILFVTKTFPHGMDGVLSDQIAGLTSARRRTRSGRWWQQTRELIELVGYIGALEFTWSERNGWHPHLHEIWFVKAGVDLPALKRRVHERWVQACEKECLGTPSFEHGVNIKFVDDDAEALARYPLFGSDLDRAAKELTHSHTKQGRSSDSVTPWDLLIAAYDGDKRAGWLWREFARAVKGRASLNWSRGLKDHFGIDEISDDELAAEQEQANEGVETVVEVSLKDWNRITFHRARQALIQYVKCFGADGAELVLELLREKDRKWLAEMHRKRMSPDAPPGHEILRQRRVRALHVAAEKEFEPCKRQSSSWALSSIAV